ncbi:MAG: DNA repair exonuclease [Paenibacillaceae bacterium]
MRPFRFLHAADLHLDSPFKGLTSLPPAVRDYIRESTFLALQRMVQVAKQEQVDFIVISGDVYDLSDRSLRAQLRFQQAMISLSEAGIHVYLIHGNHDSEDGSRARLNWPSHVHVFGSDEAGTVPCITSDGLTIAAISGISYGKASITDNLVPRFPTPSPEVYSIALLHTNVDGDASHDNYAPCTKEQLIRAGYQYWALGHIHSRRVLHEDAPFIVYPGNMQGRSVKETGAKGCYVVDVSETGGTKLSFHSTEAVRWEQRSLSIHQLQDEQDLKDRLDLFITELQNELPDIPAVVRLTLTGRGPLHRMLQQGTQLAELIHELREEQSRLIAEGGRAALFIWIESCRIETGAEIPFDQLLEQESFIGDMLRLSESLLNDESLLRQMCQEALEPLLGNMKANKWLQEVGLEQMQQWIRSARERNTDELSGEGGWSA